MIWLLAEEDGAVAGAGYALTGWHTPRQRAIGCALVVPEQRGHGVGDKLRDDDRALGREHGATELDAPVAEDDDGSLAWASARGYREVGPQLADGARPDRDGGTRPSTPPPGIEIVTWAERPELAEGSGRSRARQQPDIPGEEETDAGTFEEWLDRDMGGVEDRREAVFVAVEAGAVLGYAKLSFSAERTDRAFHDLTGVKRTQRGRGIAAALKATQIAWAKENGYESLQTANKVRNAPIRHLNAKHGYVLEPGTVIVRGAISGG